MNFTDIVDAGKISIGGLKDFANGLFHPTLRLGVTGLSRSGKTVFITSLVHALLNGAPLPMFEAYARGRIKRIYLEPQPDDDIPRFPYDEHIKTLSGESRQWPEGTRRISQLRLTLEYQPYGILARSLSSGKLHVDIIDYPGEWLLDLPLMHLTYQKWSHATFLASETEPRRSMGIEFVKRATACNANGPADESQAVQLAAEFTSYLSRCRETKSSLSSLPPGRFLMPGEMLGSPLLTFAPLPLQPDTLITSGTFASMMQRRYDAYVKHIVKPFFFGQFARLDRQIVLVDVLTPLNAGQAAIQDLQHTLTDVLSCFRQGANNPFWSIFGKRVSRVLFAATKADQLHHTSHDRLENTLRQLLEKPIATAGSSGAEMGVVALAAIRATKEATVTQKGMELPCIVGIPEAGENIGETSFAGDVEAAIFPGDLPVNAKTAIAGEATGKLHFVKFRPPLAATKHLPHIRMDRAIEFLIGDHLQ